jgi:type I restriction enzyme R subunit
MEDAVQTVMTQCELWTDVQDMPENTYECEFDLPMAAEERAKYD